MKKLRILLMLLMVFISFNVFADVGPKPSLEIIVEEMDTADYWLDLLVLDDQKHSWLDLSPEEAEKVKQLADYSDDEGFHPALLSGTRVPLFGKLKGEALSDGTYSHQFSYVGTPELFKIAILTEDGELIVSPQITRKHFQSQVIFNVNTLQGKEVLPVKSIFTEFSFRLALTLAIEFLVALLFGFSIKKYWKLLLGVNLFTQVLLNIGVIASNLYGGLFMAIFVFVLMEIAITTFETLVYVKRLKEKTRVRRVVYGITANLLSLVAGFYVNLYNLF